MDMENVLKCFENTCQTIDSFCRKHSNKQLSQAWDSRRNPYEILALISQEDRKNLQIDEEKFKEAFLIIKKIESNIDDMNVFTTFARFKKTSHQPVIQKWIASNKNIFVFMNSEYLDAIKAWAFNFIDYEEIKTKAKEENVYSNGFNVASIKFKHVQTPIPTHINSNLPKPQHGLSIKNSNHNSRAHKPAYQGSDRVRTLEELERLF